jgi:hypothetical protein
MKSVVLTWLVAFFAPVVPLTLLVGVFIAFDTYFGRKSAKKEAIGLGLQPRLYVSSKKTREGLTSKFLAYNLILISARIVDIYLLHDVVELYLPFDNIVTRLIAVVLCWVELDSIDEKYYKLYGTTITAIDLVKVAKFKKAFSFLTVKKQKDEF